MYNDVRFNCTLALHMTDVVRKQPLEVRRRIHAEEREIQLYSHSVLDLGTIWQYAESAADRHLFISVYGQYVQPMLNRLAQLKNCNNADRRRQMQMAFNLLEEITFQVAIFQTRFVDISFPGIQTVVE